MDDIAELEDIVRQAVSEGDDATANAVMDRIEQLKAAPAPLAKGGPLSRGRFETRALRDERFLAAAGDAERQATMGGLRGLARGAARAVVGGPGQLASNALPGLDEKEFTQAYGQLEQDVFGPEQAGEGFATKTGELVGAAALSPNKAGVLKGAARTTLASAVRGGAALGAIGGATAYDPEAEGPGVRALNAAIGGSLGVIVAGLPAFPPAFGNLVRRFLNGDQDPRVAQDIKTMLQNPELKKMVDELSAGQRSGSTDLQNLEAQVASSRAKQFYANQEQELYGIINKQLGGSGERVDEYKLAHVTRDAMEKVTGLNQKAASATYGKHLDEALDLARNTKTQYPVKLDKTRTWFAEHGKFAQGDIEQLLPGLPQGYRKVLEKWFLNGPAIINDEMQSLGAVGPQFRTSMEDMIVLRRVASQMRSALYKLGPSDKNSAMARAGNGLIEAIDNDIAQFEDLRANLRTSGSTIPRDLEESWERFGIANAEYKTFKKAESDLRNSALGILFGDTASVRNPGQAFEALVKTAPAQQTTLINTLNRADPQIVRDIKQWKLRETINSMVDQGERSTLGGISPKEFVKSLTDGSDVLAANLWTPAELKNIREVMAATRVIQERAGAFNRGVDIGGASVALATRSLAFGARYLAKLFAAPSLEKMMFDPAALRSLKIMASTMGKPTAATIRAAAYLTSLTTGEDRLPQDDQGNELAIQEEAP